MWSGEVSRRHLARESSCEGEGDAHVGHVMRQLGSHCHQQPDLPQRTSREDLVLWAQVGLKPGGLDWGKVEGNGDLWSRER